MQRLKSFIFTEAEQQLGAKALDALRGHNLSIGQVKRVLHAAEELLDAEPLAEPALEGLAVADQDEGGESDV